MTDLVHEEQEKLAVGDILTILRPYLTDNIVAVNVSEQDYLAKYAELHYEWVEGVLISISPITSRHQRLTHYFLDVSAPILNIVPLVSSKTNPSP